MGSSSKRPVRCPQTGTHRFRSISDRFLHVFVLSSIAADVHTRPWDETCTANPTGNPRNARPLSCYEIITSRQGENIRNSRHMWSNKPAIENGRTYEHTKARLPNSSANRGHHTSSAMQTCLRCNWGGCGGHASHFEFFGPRNVQNATPLMLRGSASGPSPDPKGLHFEFFGFQNVHNGTPLMPRGSASGPPAGFQRPSF